MEVSDQLHAPAVLPLGIEPPIPGTYWAKGWVGPRAGLDTMEKKKVSCSCWNSARLLGHSLTIREEQILVLMTFREETTCKS
jgi:hypothetical protein